MQSKKHVRYKLASAYAITVGKRACVETLDHPECSNTSHVVTSEVLAFNEATGVFETLNTIYSPV